MSENNNTDQKPTANRSDNNSNRPKNSQSKPQGNNQSRGKGGPRSNNSQKKRQGIETKDRPKTTDQARSVSRGEAIRAQKRTLDDATKLVSQYLTNSDDSPKISSLIKSTQGLKIVGLGGVDEGGASNMIVVEYEDSAVVIDCGINLGVDLPGINYAINDIAYLESISHKVKAYLITHGHLDHIGALPHIVPKVPAPIYGSKFTIGMVEKIFENSSAVMPQEFELQTVTMNEETHEKLKIGVFFVEFVRVTHSIPGSTVIVLDTPAGKVVCTGDYRLDPNPLDHEKTDVERLKEIGKEGVLVLLNETLTATRAGRTPSESTIEQTFIDLFDKSPGRVFVALFSSNINRIQMLVNAAVSNGRKIAMDGRSMMSTLEVAIRLGMIKIPKGTFVPISSVGNMKDTEVAVLSTGCQGEPNSALQRMSKGEHRNVKLKANDTVILSSTPIPETGNDKLVGSMVDELLKKGVHVFQHSTRELDGTGPLHVSGHASMEEYMDMIDFLQPRYLIPIYGTYTAQTYQLNEARKRGFPVERSSHIETGQVFSFNNDEMKIIGDVPTGTVLIDQTGAPVNNIVVKDRLILAEEGLVTVILTIDKKTGQLLTSPDIISRGFIYMRDSEELMNLFRTELRRAVTQRYKRVDLDRFKAELRDYITHFLYEQTQRSPIVIPVVNVVAGKGNGNGNGAPAKNDTQKKEEQKPEKSAEQIAADQQEHFAKLRQQLLGQDARTD
jgi:ribonuclease J